MSGAPVPLGALDATKYLVSAARSYGPAWLRSTLGRSGAWRSPPAVSRIYDELRGPRLDVGTDAAWDDVVYGAASDEVVVLVEDRLARGSYRAPRAAVLERLHHHVRTATGPGDLVVEFGSGDGRNLLYLHRALPDRRYLGLELSPRSVELARRLAGRFGAGVDFRRGDATAPLPADLPPGAAALAYSIHALEQMPRIAGHALRNMTTVSRAAVALFEPLPELWPWTPRGLISKARARAIDRVRGLMRTVAELDHAGGWRIAVRRRLGFASNPLNETCEVVLLRR